MGRNVGVKRGRSENFIAIVSGAARRLESFGPWGIFARKGSLLLIPSLSCSRRQ